MFIDTHCHLNLMVKKDFDSSLTDVHIEQIEQIIKDSKEVGVEYFINIGTNLTESLNSIKIAKRFDSVFASVGIHPCDCSDVWLANAKKIEQFVVAKQENKIVAIGETGLDFYHKPFFKQRQVDAFKFHIEHLALKNDLPVVIHMREATDETLKIIEEYKKELTGVFHCFSENKDIAAIVTSWGFYVGIDGHVTYPKNESLREVVKQIPVTSIVLETDAPFLPPQQFRGKQNGPKYIPLFADLVAKLKNITFDELSSVTTRNAKELFGSKKSEIFF